MDHLDSLQRAHITKKWMERLRNQTTTAGFDAKQVAEMSRQQLLDAWLKVVLNGKEQQPQAAAAVTVPTVSYDADLEKRRSEFAVKNFEMEMAWR